MSRDLADRKVLPMPLADWLKERLDNCHQLAATKRGADRDGWLEDAAFFHAAITQLAEAKRDGWVSLSERLPEFHGRVIVCDVHRHVRDEWADHVRFLFKAAQVEGDTCYYTHWQPLPEPPTIDAALSADPGVADTKGEKG